MYDAFRMWYIPFSSSLTLSYNRLRPELSLCLPVYLSCSTYRFSKTKKMNKKHTQQQETCVV